MTTFDTDYLVIGAGATGLAFVDTLLAQSDAHITLVDRQAQPGGHWNDAYPFVRLHQPSAFYGVNSLPLGSGRKDSLGHNAGLYELASGAEVSSYFQQVLHQQLLPSGRVRSLPMTHVAGFAQGEARLSQLMTGEQSQVRVRRKLVDATFFSPQIPATTRPRFERADGVRLVTPTQLTRLWEDPATPPQAPLCILGAGKTAMDVGVWLLSHGARPEAIHWVVPRDSWVVNRLTTQPGEEFFEHSVGGQLAQMRALAQASDVEDLFDRLEASGQMMRIDPTRRPRMFHYATLSEGEVQLLRRITQVIRLGRVLGIDQTGLRLEQGHEAMPADTVYIDCTASAVHPRPGHAIFQPGRITPQLVRAPLVTFSAAVCAYVEARYADDDEKNLLCTPVPFPRDLAGYITATLTSLSNQMHWTRDKPLRAWMRESRLDGFGKMTASVDPADTARQTMLAELRQQAMAAAFNGRRLLADQPARS